MAGRRALRAATRAMDLYSRYRQTRELGLLDESIDVARFALSAKQQDPSLHAGILSNLGNALRARFEHSADLADINAAIDAARGAIAATAKDDPHYAGRLSNLGNALRTRFEAARNPSDIDAAVAAERDALAAAPHGRPDRATILANLVTALTTRFLSSGDLADAADIDAAIHAGRDVAAATAQDLPTLIDAMYAVMARFERTEDVADINRMIELHRVILEDPAFCVLPASLRVHVLRNAGAMFLRRHHLTGNPADLQDALGPLQDGIELATPASEDLGSCLFNLGQALYNQFEDSGNPMRLEAAIAAYERIGREVPNDDVLDLPRVLMNLGHALHSKAKLFDQDALDPAIEAYRRALASTAEGSSDFPERLSGLGIALRERFRRTERRGDLDASIELQGRAVVLSAGNPSTHWAARDNLGRALSDRYESFGTKSDLEQAIVEHRAVVEHGAGSASARANALLSLGQVMYKRFRRAGDLADLDEAIRSVESAIEVSNKSSPWYGLTVDTLGSLKKERSDRRGQPADLDEAVRLQEEAVAVSPPGSPQRALTLANLSSTLFHRFLRGGGPADYSRATDALNEAAETMPPDSIDAASVAFNISHRWWAEYVHTKDPSFLENAIDGFERILARAPDASRHRLPATMGLANALRDRFRLQHRHEDLDRAVKLYRDGMGVARITAPETTLLLSRVWGDWAGERRAWNEAADALADGIRAMHDLVSVQLLRSGKESWLREARGLPVRAAYARVRAGDSHGAATDLERGRAILLSEQLDLQRADLESLSSQRQDLFERYQAVADRWDQLRRRAQGDELNITEEHPFSGNRNLARDLQLLT